LRTIQPFSSDEEQKQFESGFMPIKNSVIGQTTVRQVWLVHYANRTLSRIIGKSAFALGGTKDIGPEELAETVRKAARGESVLHSRVASRVVQELRGQKRDVPNLFTELSDRELEVLRLIADGLSNAEIAEKLVISEKTVKGHVSNILSKLHMLDRTQAAVFAWQQGLVARRDQ
jgi:ATP/maltotriose-dependent transcriptional regulator MalT